MGSAASPCFIHSSALQLWATASTLLSVLPESGGLQVVGVGLQHAGVVAAEVLAVGDVADGQLVVVAKLKEEVDGRVAAAHHRLLIAHHPVFTRRVCRRRGGEREEVGLRKREGGDSEGVKGVCGWRYHVAQRWGKGVNKWRGEQKLRLKIALFE